MAERGLVEADPIWKGAKLIADLDEPTARHPLRFATALRIELWLDSAAVGRSDTRWLLTIQSDLFVCL